MCFHREEFSIVQVHSVCGKTGLRKQRKRVGRGIGSGCGKTSGRGHKGAGSRSGHSSRLAFEGGQTAIFRRVAKRGQSSPSTKDTQLLDIAVLARVFESGATVDSNSLFDKSLITRRTQQYKILANGKISIPLNLRVRAISRSAAQLVLASGGKVEFE
jgi:large subunit ribosomal protein L15